MYKCVNRVDAINGMCHIAEINPIDVCFYIHRMGVGKWCTLLCINVESELAL